MTDMPMRLRKMTGFLLLCALAWAAAWPVLAQDTTYQATVPVADTSHAQRDQAFAEALDHVLARVAGHPLDVSAAHVKAATYVQQYQYQRAPAGAAEPFLLIVKFAPSSIHHLVDSLGGPDTGAAMASTDADDDASAFPGVAAGGESSLWVSNLHSALDFAGALAALRSIPGVDSARVQQARDAGMLLDVHTSVSLQQVLATLENGGHMTTSDDTHAGATASLRWVK